LSKKNTVKPKVKKLPAAVKTTRKVKSKAVAAPTTPAVKSTKAVNSKKKASTFRYKNYKFKNFYESETQLTAITHTSDPDKILEAYARLISVYASNHIRDGVEMDDLISEGRRGVCEAIKEFNDPNRRRPSYNFHQACLYKIRSSIFQYCLRNASLIKTPYYVQRGCMHVAQLFKLMSNSATASALIKNKADITEQDILDFIYDEKERLPLKSLAFIKRNITKKVSKQEFDQILSGILNHELGSRHSYIKNNLTDIAKCLHIKEKLWYTASCNNMDYKRVIDLILIARQSKVELNPNLQLTPTDKIENVVFRNQLAAEGERLCGKQPFEIFVKNKVMDKSYDDLALDYSLKKTEVVEIIKQCKTILQNCELFKELNFTK
jgi:RNA polymerase sigma factor (sigma-70 family)